jgi:hypothetical protein
MQLPTDPNLSALERKAYEGAKPWELETPARTNGNLDVSEVMTVFGREWEGIRTDLQAGYEKEAGTFVRADRQDIINAFIDKYAKNESPAVKGALEDMIKDHTLSDVSGPATRREVSFRIRNAALAGDFDQSRDYIRIATDNGDKAEITQATGASHGNEANDLNFPGKFLKI